MGILNELMNRHELYGGDAQASEIFNGLRMAQTGIGSAQLGWHVGMVDRKTFDMHFVDNRLMPLGTRMAVIAPVEIRRGHDAFRHEGGAVDVVRWTVRIERMRVRIASDLHDDIGSSLSSIALVTDVVRKSLTGHEAQRQQLHDASRAARHTADALKDIVWIINPEHDKLDDIVLRMK